LGRFGLDVRARLRSEIMLTPQDIRRHTGAWRGALYGISSNEPLNAFRRPHNRCPDVQGLYFAGGTTHPGGGVPMVTLSGKVASDMILSDQQPAQKGTIHDN
jgi:phytoene dehydrogenase-like protein